MEDPIKWRTAQLKGRSRPIADLRPASEIEALRRPGPFRMGVLKAGTHRASSLNDRETQLPDGRAFGVTGLAAVPPCRWVKFGEYVIASSRFSL